MTPRRAVRPRGAPDVLVAGAGMAGLGAAYEIVKAGRRPLVLEASTRAGGVVQTEEIDGFTIDLGPDSILAGKGGFASLCEELGLSDRLIPISPPGTAYVLLAGRLVALPAGAALGIPLRPATWMRNRLFDTRGKLRVLGDLVLPRGEGGDESIAAFVRRRFGEQAVRRLAHPLLAGIHSGDAERLSVQALFPSLVELERRHRSVILGMRRTAPRTPPPNGPFRSFPHGTGELVAALVAALPDGTLESGSEVRRLDRGAPYSVRLADGQVRHAPAVVLAVPAHEAARIVEAADPVLSDLCGRIRAASVATIAIGYAREAVDHPLEGSGFLVPPDEHASRLLAATWSSSKWAGRAPEGFVLLRAFIGGDRSPELLTLGDDELTRLAHAELSRVLGISRDPVVSRVQRWPKAAAQHEVGHLDLVDAIEARLAADWPGVFVSGSGFRTTGVPGCLADGRAAARRALAHLAATEGRSDGIVPHATYGSAG